MAGLTENDYYKLMKGGNIGNNFSGSHYIIRREPEEKKKNPITKEKILLNENVGMPNNYNEDYDMKLPPKKIKKRKNPAAPRIDPQLLQYLNRR